MDKRKVGGKELPTEVFVKEKCGFTAFERTIDIQLFMQWSFINRSRNDEVGMTRNMHRPLGSASQRVGFYVSVFVSHLN